MNRRMRKHFKKILIEFSERHSGKSYPISAGECPAPTRADFPLGTIQGADYSFNASIAFTCRDGYERIGLPTLTCTKHGRWNGFFPTCEGTV